MSTTAPKPSRARRTRKDTSSAGTVQKSPGSAGRVSAERRREMIAEFAYQRAERRGFDSGDPVADWLESEKEVDALLSRNAD